MTTTMICPKCQSTMEEGFIPDSNQGMNFVNMWVEGSPERSFLRGTKIEGKRSFRITAYRCSQCGYVECYAQEEVG